MSEGTTTIDKYGDIQMRF